MSRPHNSSLPQGYTSVLSINSDSNGGMKAILATLIVTTSAFAQQIDATAAGPIYDHEGHLTTYKYADGTQDSYAYDGQWRMKSFTDRNGYVTVFIYGEDGSVTTIKPDRTHN